MSILILLVDDHAETRREIRALLDAETDFEVIGEAASGAEAIRRVEELQPDVALMDLMMPGIDGIQATRRIRADFPEVRIVGFSLYDTPVLREAVLASGASCFVDKATAEKELAQAIRSCVSEKSLPG